MKKSFFKSIRLAGLFLLGSVAMVGCYEGDDNVDYVQEKPGTGGETPLPDPKYHVFCTVEDEVGNAVNANVTLYHNGNQIATEKTSSLSYDATKQGAGSYYVTAECEGYYKVTKPAQYMLEGDKGTVNVLSFKVTMTENPNYGDPVGELELDETNDEVKVAVEDAIKESLKDVTIDGATLDGLQSNIVEITVLDEDGNPIKVKAVQVDANFALAENTNAKEITFIAPLTEGYNRVGELEEVSRALTPTEVWENQANVYFGVKAPGFQKVLKKIVYKNPNGYLIKGYKIREYFVQQRFAFNCDGIVYSASAQYSVGGRLTALHVDDSHDNHDDSHDDHHDNGGTAWGGGTTGR